MVICANVHCQLEFEPAPRHAHQKYCSPRCNQQGWLANLSPARAAEVRAAKTASMRRARAKAKV